MTNFEHSTAGVAEKPKTEKINEQNLASQDIKPEIVTEIKKEDAGNLEAAKIELQNFVAENKESNESKENKEFFDLAAQKLDEMQAKIDEKKTGFINKVFYKNDIKHAEDIIRIARKRLNNGESVDMATVKEKVKIADVDVSGFPERKGKRHAGPTRLGV